MCLGDHFRFGGLRCNHGDQLIGWNKSLVAVFKKCSRLIFVKIRFELSSPASHVDIWNFTTQIFYHVIHNKIWHVSKDLQPRNITMLDSDTSPDVDISETRCLKCISNGAATRHPPQRIFNSNLAKSLLSTFSLLSCSVQIFATQFDNWSECSGRTSFHKISRDLGLRCNVNAYHILPARFCSDYTVVQRQSLNMSCTCIVSHFEKQNGVWSAKTESTLIARFMVKYGAHLGLTGPRWAPCWPHESCYLGIVEIHRKSAGTLVIRCLTCLCTGPKLEGLLKWMYVFTVETKWYKWIICDKFFVRREYVMLACK